MEIIFYDREQQPHQLVYLAAEPGKLIPACSDNLVVIDYMPSGKPISSGFNMVISLTQKERSGATDIGEEFVRFLSRHGIRFNRIDT
jgi:hypothetical protein